MLAQPGTLSLEELTAYPGTGFPVDVAGVVTGVAALDPVALIQAGLLLLIATPLLRVVLAGLFFCRQREWLFAVVSLAVLSVLVWGWRGL
jgi:uncharacterized membrane protein